MSLLSEDRLSQNGFCNQKQNVVRCDWVFTVKSVIYLMKNVEQMMIVNLKQKNIT
jgi:hypothetical protein